MKKLYIVLLLATCIFSTACSKYFNYNVINYKSSTSVMLKDSYTVNISIEFGFKTEKELRAFKYKEKKILHTLRLSMMQYESSTLKKHGKKNVVNALTSICKHHLKNKLAKIKITEYNFKIT